MCYHLRSKYSTQKKRELEKNPKDIIERIDEESTYINFHHVSGYNHPKILVYTNDSPNRTTSITWGLIPHWARSEEEAFKLWNSTLNCRSESMFEKPSFRDVALNNRCVIAVDGFYEYHHHKGKKYPYYVSLNDGSPIYLGGLWSEWLNTDTGELQKTFTIVTTKGNELLSTIHNNPKLNEARMPLILGKGLIEPWLDIAAKKKEVKDLISSFPDSDMKAYTVGKLQGKNYVGNVEEIITPVTYPELLPQRDLFS